MTIVEDVMTSCGGDSTAIHKELVASLGMVVEGYGMTAVEQMEYFCSIVTKAHILDLVFNEAIAFKRALEAFKTKHGNNWKYGRVMKLEGIDSLNGRKFPHL